MHSMTPFKDEENTLAIDFDGVIHKNSKGFHDGTIYDDLIEGTKEALEELSKKYRLVIFSAKARKDRPLINDKTGIQLIWEYLHKHELDSYVDTVTSEKPRAFAYIDDRGIRFTNWKDCLNSL
jgi:hypothetical protein